MLRTMSKWLKMIGEVWSLSVYLPVFLFVCLLGLVFFNLDFRALVSSKDDNLTF